MELTVVSADGSKWKTIMEKQAGTRYVGWRCLHQAEGGYPNPDKMPVVRPSIQGLSVNFTSTLQLMSYEINKFNPLFTKGRWRGVWGNWTAFTNGNGFDDPNDPRADWVNLMDIRYPLPKLMRAIICGGNFFTGKASYSLSVAMSVFSSEIKNLFVKQNQFLPRRKSIKRAFTAIASTVNNVVTMTPGIDAIDVNNYPPGIQEFSKLVLDKHWYFHATTRSGDRINNFPQGWGSPVFVPYCLSAPASYPLSWFEPWNETYLPDPLKIYKPI